MLPRLILFLIFGLATYVGVRWWRSRKMLRSGGLNVIELSGLMKLAKRSPRIEMALNMRLMIVDAAGDDERRKIADRVDSVIRRLAKQEELGEKITAALDSIDKKALRERVDDARVDAETATDPDERERQRERLTGLETQAEHVEKLSTRKEELRLAAERIMVELRNLQLAMLDAKSSQEALGSDAVKHALSELEDTSDALRRETSADEEVNRMLRAAAARQRQ